MRTKKLNLAEQVALSRLLSEIEDMSLQNTIRKTIYTNENLSQIIKKERPELSEEELNDIFKPSSL